VTLLLLRLTPLRPIQRFWFLEMVARMPYFSYITMLHLYESFGWWRAGGFVCARRVAQLRGGTLLEWSCLPVAVPTAVVACRVHLSVRVRKQSYTEPLESSSRMCERRPQLCAVPRPCKAGHRPC